jgi:hypothetical protein
MLTALQEIPAWLSFFVAATGAVVSGLNLGRSRWAPILLGGFVAETIASLFFRAASLGLRSGALQTSGIGVAFLVANLLGLIGQGTIVAGLAGMFSDLRRSGPGAGAGQALP